MTSLTFPLHVRSDDLDLIIEALRCLQVYGQDDVNEQNARDEEIDDLCERLNVGE